MVSQTVNDQCQDEAPALDAARNQPQDPPYGMPLTLMQADPVIQEIEPPATPLDKDRGRPQGSQNARNA